MLSPQLLFSVIYFSFSLLLSTSVLLFLLVIQVRTKSGLLTFFLNLSFFIITLTKFPVYLVRVPYACPIAGYLYWYFSTFGLLVLYDMVGAVNLRMLVNDQVTRTISRASEYQLQNGNILRLILVSFLSLIVPLCSESFIKTEHYCEIDRGSQRGLYSRIAYLIATLFLQLVILYKLYRICQLLKKSLNVLTYQYLLWKLLSGPGAYPIYLVTATLIADVFVLVAYLSRSHPQQSDEGSDQSDYKLEILQASLGIIAALIFYFIERKDIQAFELHFKEMRDFEDMIGRNSERSEGSGYIGEKEMPTLSSGSGSHPSGRCSFADRHSHGDCLLPTTSPLNRLHDGR